MRHARCRRRTLPFLSIAVLASLSSVAGEAGRPLGLDARVAAEAAIQRVYYGRQIGATSPFEEAVPRGVLERRVRTYLKQSAALGEYWKTPVTAEMLRAEWERIARATRFPDRLLEIYRALGDDPFLIQECFVRPVLVDRLSRSFFAQDKRFQDVPARDGSEAAPVRPWDVWWHEVAGDLREETIAAVASDPEERARRNDFLAQGTAGEAPFPSVAAAGCAPDDTWDLDDLPEATTRHTAVWTGTHMIVWGGEPFTLLFDAGGKYDPLTDTWSAISSVGAPTPRHDHAAVWDGSEMLVWGGEKNDPLIGGAAQPLGPGGRYDPLLDTWSPISSLGEPARRRAPTAVWTGSEMIVWGGHDHLGWFATGGRYDPLADSWTPTSTTAAPDAREGTTAVWTGSRMLIWGGYGTGGVLGSGARYDPVNDVWTPTSPVAAPSPRYAHTAVWTGSRMIVWGGKVSSTSLLATGAQYDPVADAWVPTSATNVPSGRSGHVAVWSGSAMVVWGGGQNTGGRYDPAGDTWSALSTVNAPERRESATAVWTGDLMVIWGGKSGYYSLDSGGRYDPATDTWTPTARGSAPSARYDHTAVWTGTHLIVWGGDFPEFDTGGKYDPLTDTWTATSTLGAPQARARHTAVWTGTRMVIWGGQDSLGWVATGGRYDPLADSWTPTSTTAAPDAREGTTAVWTGSRMLIWGGYGTGGVLGSGARYDPATDTWASMTSGGAPTARAYHPAVWSGSRMLVWGGRGSSDTRLGTGGAYDPVSDHWSPTSTLDAPSPRVGHTAVWTGEEMIVWGGGDVFLTDTGGRYDPVADAWTPTSTTMAPWTRSGHTAVWTGDEMIVWGGLLSSGTPFGTRWETDTGGRYDPATNTWLATSTTAAPLPRSAHTANWIGGSLRVWGGLLQFHPMRGGGVYSLGAASDRDQDGTSLCGGDCDDLDGSIHPGAAQTCDGRDTDCDGAIPATEHDADGDGAPECSDCDDGDPVRYPGNVELCDGIDNDCSGVVDAPSPPESNDSQDNQCSGDPGFGLVDEVSGSAGFSVPGDPAQFCWPAQAGATEYQVLRSTARDFAGGCTSFVTGSTCRSDPTLPASKTAFHYLVRALAPYVGSLGADSAGVERAGVCGVEFICDDGVDDDGDGATDCADFADCFAADGCVATLAFTDTPGDDASTPAIEQFFQAVPEGASDYLYLSLRGPTVADFEICVARADFYGASYLSMAPSFGTATSGAWDKWYRLEGGGWIGPDLSGHDNLFGDDCAGAYSWCAEVGLGGHIPAAAPAETGICEAFDYITCGDGSWTFTLQIGSDRLSACGF